MTSYQTEQEEFWAGDFGREYGLRNTGPGLLASNIHLFSKILPLCRSVKSVVEFGSNIGMNLQAIRTLLPTVELSAIEINSHAIRELKKWAGDTVTVYADSILEFKPDRQWDLTLIKGVLIHINPEKLAGLYDILHRSTRRYLCVAEYYNPSPVTVKYRGHENRLFKRDFCGEMMDRFPDLSLLDYGFAYHRDPNYPHDDITWFLLEKK